MAHSRALTGNAADPEQQRYASRKERQREERFLGALRSVLATPAGRFALAGLLELAGIDRVLFDLDVGAMYFGAGERSTGLKIREWLRRADDRLFDQLEREYRGFCRSEDGEVEAVQTRLAHEADTDT